MIQIFLFWAAISVASPIPKPLQDLQKTFHGRKGFEVEFSQEVKQSPFPEKVGAKTSVATGKVKFERPHQLKWTYEKPQIRIIEYDGKHLTITDGKQKEEVADSGKLNLQESFSFLWGQTDSSIFKIEGRGSDDFRLVPKDSSKAMFKYIDVTVKNGKVVSAKVQSSIEGVSELKFQNWKVF
jgi:outer membrane lipoprotein-sorting protein